jgi:uncharacterized protein (DUF433 family)
LLVSFCLVHQNIYLCHSPSNHTYYEILGYPENGASGEDIQKEFPGLTQEDIKACLGYARDLSAFEVMA